MDLDFVTREFPVRIADLGFAVKLPRSWQPQDLPDQAPSFDQPTHLFGLAAVAAPYAAIVFAAAARPAYDNGSVLDWAQWLITQGGVDLRALGPSQLGALPAIVGQCAAASDMGEMTTFFAFAEDGGRLVHASLSGPRALEGHVWSAWREVLASFALASPQGATVPLAPAPAVHEPPEGSDAAVSDVGRFALEGGLATLQQEHPLNQRLLQQGRGFAPPIRAADEASGKAWVSSMALQAVLALPLGWHALDDSRRLLLLDPANEVQVSLERLSAPGEDAELAWAQLLDRIEAQARQDYPAPEFLRLRNGPVLGLAVRGIADGEQALQQLHLLIAADTAQTVIRARVTSTPQRSSMAGDLGEALLHGIGFVSDLSPAAVDGPATAAAGNGAEPSSAPADWAEQARVLEAAGRLQEAEQVMLEGCDQQGVLMSIAWMYRRRMQQLAAAGDAEGAALARQRAIRWAWQYAGGATSGGEGVALSRERDEFIASLGQAV